MFVEDAPARIRAVANCLLVVSTTDEAFPLCNDTRYLYHARPASPEKDSRPFSCSPDSQSVKAPHASDRGIDAHKKIVGRKRHVAVDSDGRLLLVNMTPANVADSTGAQMILDAMYRKWPSVKHFFADGAYERKSLMDKATYLGFVVEVVKRTPGQTGFQPVAKRWVVERTFGWLVRWRRLVRDYERRLDVSESMIQIAMASILLKRFIIDK